MGEKWSKSPALEGGFVGGCLCCGVKADVLAMESIVAVGFGDAHCSRDGEVVFSEFAAPKDREFWTVQDAEDRAAADPDHDWRISYRAPLYDAVYQRHGDATWVLIAKGEGFA